MEQGMRAGPVVIPAASCEEHQQMVLIDFVYYHHHGDMPMAGSLMCVPCDQLPPGHSILDKPGTVISRPPNHASHAQHRNPRAWVLCTHGHSKRGNGETVGVLDGRIEPCCMRSSNGLASVSRGMKCSCLGIGFSRVPHVGPHINTWVHRYTVRVYLSGCLSRYLSGYVSGYVSVCLFRVWLAVLQRLCCSFESLPDCLLLPPGTCYHHWTARKV